MKPRLALFDLDNTLLAGDSDHAWGEFLIDQKMVDESAHRQTNDQFYQQYLDGKLDIHGYVEFTLTPILEHDIGSLRLLHEQFMSSIVRPMMLDKSRALIANHQSAGDCCVIITATNSFITTPIASAFGIDNLLATELEIKDGKYTGKIEGIPCYQQGKVRKLENWLSKQNIGLEIADSVFYTDSINDLPLMKQVAEPVAVDADEKLSAFAAEKGWQQISLRGG